MVYPDDLTGFHFGTLTVLGRAAGYENENKMWRCACNCGHPNCKKVVVIRRGNLTRKTDWKLTCGAHGNDAEQTAVTKLLAGCVQRNSKTGISGVNKSFKYPGMFRARISINNRRITMDNLTLHDAVLVRNTLELVAKTIHGISIEEGVLNGEPKDSGTETRSVGRGNPGTR